MKWNWTKLMFTVYVWIFCRCQPEVSIIGSDEMLGTRQKGWPAMLRHFLTVLMTWTDNSTIFNVINLFYRNIIYLKSVFLLSTHAKKIPQGINKTNWRVKTSLLISRYQAHVDVSSTFFLRFFFFLQHSSPIYKKKHFSFTEIS